MPWALKMPKILLPISTRHWQKYTIKDTKAMIVHKFGGTSLGNAQCFSNVANIIFSQIGSAHPGKNQSEEIHQGIPANSNIVIVVSAMSGVTDQLIAGARAAAEGRDSIYREIKADLLKKHLEVAETLLINNPARLETSGFLEDQLHELERLYRSIAILGELTVRGCDAVAAFGERLSSNLLAAVLREGGIRAQAVMATELIVTDNKFGAAEPLPKETYQKLTFRIKPLLERGVVPVVTGYIASTSEGITTTLGRGGSDYTAALIGAHLDADEVRIWSDVDGILTADPNIESAACTIQELSYSEAAELAYFGAEVLHPKTIKPIVEKEIPLRILNSFHPDHPGTLIIRSPQPEKQALFAIISTRGLSMIGIGCDDDSWTLLNAAMVLKCLGDGGVDVLLFSQSFSEHSLNLVVREENQSYSLELLAHQFQPGFDSENTGWALEDGRNKQMAPGYDNGVILGVKDRVATISVIGLSDREKNGIVAHTFSALGKFGTRVLAITQAGKEHSISFCIPEDQMVGTVNFLHSELGLNFKMY
jgi:aspartokinase/homoserine dehydrogenase 1